MPKAKRDPNLNPLTGQPANAFTQVTNRTLPEPTKVREFGPAQKGIKSTKNRPLSDEDIAHRVEQNEKATGEFAASGRRMRALHREATKPGGVVDAQVGYRKPAGMADRDFAWVTGARRASEGPQMFPNRSAEANEPAINEPHEAHPNVTVQRRAEDLTGGEYRKGLDVLAHYGHNPKDPMGSLIDTQRRTLHRVIAEHAQAGVEESASQLFYGGPVNTEIHDPVLDAAHTEGVMAAHKRFREAVQRTALHPEFINKTPNLTHRTRMDAAAALVAQSVADTSPNSKYRDSNNRWPNIEQAEEAVHSGLTGQEPKFISGRVQNNEKAAGRVADMIRHGDFTTHDYGNPKDAAKTVAFRGGLSRRDIADAFKVSDVHEASVIAPGLSTAKGKMYHNQYGEKVTVHADAPRNATRGLAPIMVPLGGERGAKGAMKHDVGLSRPEEMLAKGSSLVHTLNDYATRHVLAEHGLSRGVNYSDNVHATQGATWGSQQVLRHDVNVSHADQYPVVRDWGREGINVPKSDDVLGSLSRGEVHTTLGQQWRTNPNTTAISKSPETAHLVNPTKSKPYPVMPGD